MVVVVMVVVVMVVVVMTILTDLGSSNDTS